jgi:hypothetical protein
LRCAVLPFRLLGADASREGLKPEVPDGIWEVRLGAPFERRAMRQTELRATGTAVLGTECTVVWEGGFHAPLPDSVVESTWD